MAAYDEEDLKRIDRGEARPGTLKEARQEGGSDPLPRPQSTYERIKGYFGVGRPDANRGRRDTRR